MITTKQLVIITGLSGAGKSNAVKEFEDMGFFCVDNLPAPLIPKFAELCISSGQIDKMALVIDIRGGMFLNELDNSLQMLTEMEIDYNILFLEASDEVLISRFKETRRNHPMSNGSLAESIQEERKKLSELRGKADRIIDTSRLSNRQLRDIIGDEWYGEKRKMSVTIMSFGYKHGVPGDMDLLLDVRFLPNPYYIPELKALTGRDAAVRKYVMDSAVSQAFLQKYTDLLLFLLPHYIAEGKSHLTIGIGCTGGQHRSITLAIEVGNILRENGYEVLIKHRDN